MRFREISRWTKVILSLVVLAVPVSLATVIGSDRVGEDQARSITGGAFFLQVEHQRRPRMHGCRLPADEFYRYGHRVQLQHHERNRLREVCRNLRGFHPELLLVAH